MKLKTVPLVTFGIFFEYFDLMLYVHMAIIINELFFVSNDTQSMFLVAAFSFSSAYIFRPLGALVFGYIGDRKGRKVVLFSTAFLMALSCIIMAFAPTYAQVGVLASWIVTICRMLQGFSCIGNSISTQLYLTEVKDKAINNFRAVAMVPLAISIGSTVALIVGMATFHFQLNWRFAFVIGALIAVVGVIIRRNLNESLEEFNSKNVSKSSSLDESGNSTFIKSFILFLMEGLWPTCFYYVYVYSGVILKSTFHYTTYQVIQQSLIISFVQILSDYLFVVLSKRGLSIVYLKTKLIIFTLALPFISYMYTINTAMDVLFLQAFVIFFAVDTVSIGGMVYKQFPIKNRFTLVGIIYAFSRTAIYVLIPLAFVYFENGNVLSNSMLFMFIFFSGVFYVGLRYFQRRDALNG
jgi:MFS family permease